ncbi:hypothetical protein [Acetobacter sp.]|jgi:hypothetical protein|uniref:hypothetical protein n=1 Tax=Acetobacter sp. TaxID=440 RepID=UPI0025BDC570|nr:hypothetical protein [Acetobacter sp.]MCH4091556.1 hypothetical protein [Acetobacter sp.]MCI1299534.1 hypothetical protein [Acetobacter sp.]MCI1316876.1 hypothetical protein [Acetobacter sp.]
MATTSEIENIICKEIYDYIYPDNSNGILSSSINQDVKISRGWPQEAEISRDLMSSSEISWIVVNQQYGQTKNKTRYGRKWKLLDEENSFGITLDNFIDSAYYVQFNGLSIHDGLAGIVIDKSAYPVSVKSGQNSQTIAKNIYQTIQENYSGKISLDGSTIISKTELPIKGFCGKNTTMYQEISRLEETFCTSIFSSSIINRDNIENAVMASLLSGGFEKPLIDFSCA